ncbi:MAG: BsuPI-related putative proteinase inhibitor [Chthoniobacterales bacterium]
MRKSLAMCFVFATQRKILYETSMPIFMRTLILLTLVYSFSALPQLRAQENNRNAELQRIVAEELGEGATVYDVIDLRRPDEASPFFLNQSMAYYYTTEAGKEELLNRSVAKYPSTKTPDSADVYVKKFFTGLFDSVKLGSADGSQPSTLVVEPQKFTLADRREIDVTFQVKNKTRNLMKLHFGTGQRFDVTIQDATGRVIERWSDDRAFEKSEGLVTINPREFIEYSARIPTRELKAGETYYVEASLADNPEFKAIQEISPR